MSCTAQPSNPPRLHFHLETARFSLCGETSKWCHLTVKILHRGLLLFSIKPRQLLLQALPTDHQSNTWRNLCYHLSLPLSPHACIQNSKRQSRSGFVKETMPAPSSCCAFTKQGWSSSLVFLVQKITRRCINKEKAKNGITS